MPQTNRKPASDKKIAANRRNARKSTGPRRPRARATRAEVRQSRYVKSLYYDQAKLGENPEDFQEFLDDMIADWQPVGAMEMTLVEDLATLEMERRLVDRAQRGRIVARLEREEVAVSRTMRRLEEDATPAATHDEVVARGLRNAPDSAGKYREMMNLLEALIAMVKIGDFSCPADSVFTTLYGQQPSWRAVKIINSYKRFVQRFEESPESFPRLLDREQPSRTVSNEGEPDQSEDYIEEALNKPGCPQPWGEPASPSGSSPSGAEDDHRKLHRLMLEEYNAVVSDYRDFICERADLSRARRDALLAPRGSRSALIIRQKNSIDRHIERKIKLLLLLQKERRGREAARAAAPKNARRPRASQALPSGAPWSRGAGARTFAAGAFCFILGVALARPLLSLASSAAMSRFAPRVVTAPGLAVSHCGLTAASLAGPAVPLRRHGRFSQLQSAPRGGASPLSLRAALFLRDVFLHHESHQVFENKATASAAKAKTWLTSAGPLTPSVHRADKPKCWIPKEGIPVFNLHPLPFRPLLVRCYAFQTVT